MAEKFKLSVIVPAFNEAAVIGRTLEALAKYLEANPELDHTEVIVVAAGSDATADIARSYREQFDSLQVITPPSRAGKGRDVRLGFQAARGRFQLFTDADLSTPLHHIKDAVKLLEGGNNVVIGRRNLPRIHKGIARSLVSVLSNRFIRFLLLPRIHDSQCGFKAFTAEAAKHVYSSDRWVNGWAFDVEVLAAARQARYRIVELPINDWRETRGTDLRSDRLLGAVVRTLGDVVRLRIALWVASLARRINYLIVAGAVVSGGLSLWIGMKQSVWFDEAYSIALAQHSFADIVRLTAADVHPPLYYFLLKCWTLVFGTGDLALRSLSVVFAGAALLVGLWLIKRLWGARTALLVLPFVVIAPFFLRYGFEVRMYSLTALLCVSATYVLIGAFMARTSGRRWLLWTLYTLLVAAGMYTLYYTAIVWIAHFIWCIYMARRRDAKVRWRAMPEQPWVASYCAAIILFLPWLPVFLSQLHNVQNGFWISPVSYSRVVSLMSFILSYQADWQLGPWQSLVFMGAVVAVFCFIIAAFRSSDTEHRRYLVLLTLCTVVPVAVLYLASLPPLKPVFVERYDMPATLLVYLLIGVAVATCLRNKLSAVRLLASLGLLAVLVQGVVTLYHVGNFTFDQLDKPTAKYIAAYVRQHAAPTEPIVTDGAYAYIELEHYLPGSNLYFYMSQRVGTIGGYAMLHDSPRWVQSPSAFTGEDVWVVYATPTLDYGIANHQRSYGTQIGRYKAYLYNYRPTAGSTTIYSTHQLERL